MTYYENEKVSLRSTSFLQVNIKKISAS